MSPPLNALLDRGVPEPRRHLHPEWIAENARRRMRNRRQAVGMAVAMGLVVAAVAVSDVSPADPWSGPARPPAEELADVDLTISALDETAVAEEGTLWRQFVDSLDPRSPGAHVITHDDGAQHLTFLVPAVDGSFCVGRWLQGGAGYSCDHRAEDLLTRGVTSFGEDPHGHVQLTVVVPDGYERVHVQLSDGEELSSEVTLNTADFMWTGSAGPVGELALTGSEVPTVRVPVEGAGIRPSAGRGAP